MKHYPHPFRTNYTPQGCDKRRFTVKRLIDVLSLIFTVCAFLYLLGIFGPNRDRQVSQYHESQSLIDAERAALSAFKRDMAAAKLCRQEHGEAGFTYTADGELVCIPRHGKRVLASNP